MKKSSTTVIGMDLGDRFSHIYVLNSHGRCLEQLKCTTTPLGVKKAFRGRPKSKVIIEAGTHSPWVSRCLEELGHEVVVANPRRVRAISANVYKTDEVDAELLARLGRVDEKLLWPIKHRSLRAQIDLMSLRARDVMIRARTTLVNSVRGLVKSSGLRIPSCTTPALPKRCRELLNDELRTAIEPLLTSIETLNEQIKELDKHISKGLATRYPEIERLQQVDGVGPITAAAMVLTIDDPFRFRRSRSVGAHLGLTPGKNQSGERDPELHITHCGDKLMRRLLVGCAQYILGPFGKDSDLRRFGLRLAARGGRAAKRRAAVATARKLAVLLHQLWVSGTQYEPLRQAEARSTKAA